ncbi:hypothetical protein ACFX12_018374 [Malus domestica]
MILQSRDLISFMVPFAPSWFNPSNGTDMKRDAKVIISHTKKFGKVECVVTHNTLRATVALMTLFMNFSLFPPLHPHQNLTVPYHPWNSIPDLMA